MKQEFISYLKEIDLSDILSQSIIGNYEKLTNVADIDEFDDIFISEGISNDNREYFGLWGFTPHMIGFIPITGKDISIIKIQSVISSFTINEFNFDLKKPSADSKLNCYIKRIHIERSLIFNSTGFNCIQLLRLCKKYFIKQIND